jgi:hypothetical protein
MDELVDKVCQATILVILVNKWTVLQILVQASVLNCNMERE